MAAADGLRQDLAEDVGLGEALGADLRHVLRRDGAGGQDEKQRG